MPVCGHKTTWKARSRLLLNVAFVAWLSTAITTCPVLSSGAIASEHPAAEIHQTDCHGVHLEDVANSATDCRCDAIAAAATKSKKTQRADWVAATPSIPLSVTLPFAPVVQNHAAPRAPFDTGPAVYLATQRFRI